MNLDDIVLVDYEFVDKDGNTIGTMYECYKANSNRKRPIKITKELENHIKNELFDYLKTSDVYDEESIDKNNFEVKYIEDHVLAIVHDKSKHKIEVAK